MALKNYEELNELQLDAIREIASIGAGNAATALSALLEQKVIITRPTVSILNFNQATKVMGGPEKIVSGVMVQISGGIHGIMLYVQEMDFVNIILEHVLGKKIAHYSELDNLGQSALVEISNIIISSYTTALSGLTDIDIALSVPAHSINMAASLLTVPLAELNLTGDKVMFLDGNFFCGGKEASSKLLLVPDVDSLNLLLTNLGVHGE